MMIPVLRIRDVFPGSYFFYPGSELSPSWIRIKEYKYFNPQKNNKMVSKLYKI